MLERLNAIDWLAFPQPANNTPNTIASALIALSTADSNDGAQRAYHRLLYALGNDHAGTYYPVVLQALPFLGQIVEHGPDPACAAALDALIDLVGSFWPEPGFETIVDTDGTSIHLKTSVLQCARQLRPIIETTEVSDRASAKTKQLAHELLSLMNEQELEGRTLRFLPRSIQDLISTHHSYGDRFVGAMREVHVNLPEQLDRLDGLPETIGTEAIRSALVFACQTQNMANIELGRAALIAMPRVWLMARIERCAEQELHLEDEWEVRRLLEVLELLDEKLLHAVATHLLSSSDTEIQEVARDVLDAARANKPL